MLGVALASSVTVRTRAGHDAVSTTACRLLRAEYERRSVVKPFIVNSNSDTPLPVQPRDAPRREAPAPSGKGGRERRDEPIGGIGSDIGPDLGPGMGAEVGRSLDARVALRRVWRPALVAAALVAAGCASTKIDTQWSDPQFAGRSLQGKRVLVSCDSGDAALRRACQEQLAAEVTALGASVVAGPGIAHPSPGRQAAAEHLLPAARAARADAVFAASIIPDSFAVNPGPTIGIGVGGFGGGRVGWGGGVGVSVPIGEAQRQTGYAASATLTDTASGRLMWSAKASAPAARDAEGQAVDLARAVAKAAHDAGLF